MSEPLLAVREIHTYYGDSYVLQGVSLTVEHGRVVGILGRNGMGKTTLVRSIIGFTPPRRGQVVFKGRDITGWASDRAVALGLGLVPQGRRVFPSLTGRENLEVAARRDGGSGWTLGGVMDLFPRLRERAESRAATLSGGEQQMCAIGRALMSGPKLLLLDEPSAGLAPAVVQSIFALVKRICSEGYTVLIVEQNVQQVLKVVDRAYLLETGRIQSSGDAGTLAASEEIRKAYLGI